MVNSDAVLLKRAEIAELDEELAELLARRCSLAREIADERKALGQPLRDIEQETRVIERQGELLAGFYTPTAVSAVWGGLFDDVERW